MTSTQLDLDELEAKANRFREHAWSPFDRDEVLALIERTKRAERDAGAFAARLCGSHYGDEYGNARCAKQDELRAEVERLRGEVGCRTCKEGRYPQLQIDKNGTFASVSGLPGYNGHAADDFHWFCDDRGNPPPELIEADRDRWKERAEELLLARIEMHGLKEQYREERDRARAWAKLWKRLAIRKKGTIRWTAYAIEGFRRRADKDRARAEAWKKAALTHGTEQFAALEAARKLEGE